MELSTAKEILKERVKIDRSLRDSVESDFDEFCENECIAIDTVLKALDNSISKDEVRKIINNKCYVEVSDYLDTINGIEELLGKE